MTQTKPATPATFNHADLIRDYAAHSLWANRRMVNWLQTLPAELIDKEVISSFPGIRATLSHIWDTEKYWLSTLRGKVEKPAYGQSFHGSVKELFDGLLAHSEDFEIHVRSLSDDELAASITFLAPVRWPEWDSFERAASELILHTLNHNTHHRGQIATIARNLGLTDIPMTDYMYYQLMYKPYATSPKQLS